MVPVVTLASLRDWGERFGCGVLSAVPRAPAGGVLVRRHSLSDPLGIFERSSKELDSQPNLCSNTAVGQPGSLTPLATWVRPGAAWGSALPGRPAAAREDMT